MSFHLWTALVFFAVALLLCHVPIMWVKLVKGGIVESKDRWAKTWEFTDYIYLGLAAVALISAANEGRRLYSGTVLKQRLAVSAYNRGFGHNTLRTYEHLGPDERKESIGSRLREAILVIDLSYPYVNEAQDLLRVGQNEEAKLKLKKAIQTYDKFLSSPDPSLDPNDSWSKDVQMMRSQVQINRDDANDLLKLSERMGKEEGEITLVFLSPFLLGLGLAVRIAKVTAKLVAVRERSEA